MQLSEQRENFVVLTHTRSSSLMFLAWTPTGLVLLFFLALTLTQNATLRKGEKKPVGKRRVHNFLLLLQLSQFPDAARVCQASPTTAQATSLLRTIWSGCCSLPLSHSCSPPAPWSSW